MPGYRVTGCLGPRSQAQWQTTDPTSLDYDETPDLVPWANEHLAEFDLTG